MTTRDVVVIGASTGGVEAISTIVAGLPGDFGAAVFVVLHLGEHSRSHLPEILNRIGKLPAAHAWVPLRALEERAAVMRKLADHARRRGHVTVARTFDGKARQVNEDAAVIHDLITTGRALEPVGSDERLPEN